jgi:SAM-dependent methyltransferase
MIFILVMIVLIILITLLSIIPHIKKGGNINSTRDLAPVSTPVSTPALASVSTPALAPDLNMLKLIKEIYVDGFIRLPDNKMHGDQYNLTYGELTSEGMENIIKYLKSRGIKMRDSTFIDLGCGNGKTLVYAIIYGFKQARGTEIVKERYEYALKKRELLAPNVKDYITISNLDIFDLPSKYFTPTIDSEYVIIFISNLLFPEETTQKIIQFLSKIVAKNTIIIASKIPNKLYKFKFVKQIDIPMSWSIQSSCYILSIN